VRAGEQGPWDRAGEHDFRGEPTQADGGEAAGAQREAPPEQCPARVILESKPASFKVRRRAGPAHAKSAAVKPASFARTRTSPFSRVARASRLAFHAAQRHLVEQYVPVARFGVNSRSQNAQCMPNTSFPFQRILGRQTARWGHSHERPRGVSAAAGGRVGRSHHRGRARRHHAPAPPMALAGFRLRGGCVALRRFATFCLSHFPTSRYLSARDPRRGYGTSPNRGRRGSSRV